MLTWTSNKDVPHALSYTWSPLAWMPLARAFQPASLLLGSWLWPCSAQLYHLPLDAGVSSTERGSVAALIFYALGGCMGQLGSWHLPWS